MVSRTTPLCEGAPSVALPDRSDYSDNGCARSRWECYDRGDGWSFAHRAACGGPDGWQAFMDIADEEYLAQAIAAATPFYDDLRMVYRQS